MVISDNNIKNSVNSSSKLSEDVKKNNAKTYQILPFLE